MSARRLLAFALIPLASALAFQAVADDAQTCAKASGETAITACSRAIASGTVTGKMLALAYSNRGVEWQARGEYAKAMADHDAAVRADPRLAAVYNNRGIAYAAAADYDRAIADYNQAIKLDPGYAAALNNRGLAHFKKGESQRAIADYDAALQLSARKASSLYGRGIAKLRIGDASGHTDIADAKAIDPRIAD